MKKYISFSLWGDKPVYTIGAIKNAELVSLIYPDYSMVVFHDDTVPEEILVKLIDLGVELVLVTEKNIHPSFWRFFIVDRKDCERAIFRDADSRISKRESLAVGEWTKENKVLHVMRDHPFHQIPFGTDKLGILAGMWGIKGGYVLMQDMICKFLDSKTNQKYGIDQTFLESIYKKFYDDKTVHDEFFEGNKFPIKRSKYSFVGERIDEKEQVIGEDWKHIEMHERKFQGRLQRLLLKLLR